MICFSICPILNEALTLLMSGKDKSNAVSICMLCPDVKTSKQASLVYIYKFDMLSTPRKVPSNSSASQVALYFAAGGRCLYAPIINILTTLCSPNFKFGASDNVIHWDSADLVVSMVL